MKAIITLSDGTTFEGKSFGAQGERCAEVVFNTSLTGYQEILTDPSYKGQFVTMTYPLIGNYGLNSEDIESAKPFVEGFIVKECSRITSNWRSEISLSEYLKQNNILGIEGIDTRSLTKHIREHGAMKAVISTIDTDQKSLQKKANDFSGLEGVNLVKDVSPAEKYVWSDKGEFHVVVIDCGVKYNILRNLQQHSCKVTVMPYNTPAKDILKENPDGIMLSNGPGDPAAVDSIVETIQELLKAEIPMFGICLGQQMLGQALGGKTYKLKFGHHGGNHPVKDLKTDKVAISVQNHGFCVDIDSLPKEDIEITHMNLNDKTLEGIKHKTLPVFSVQFHPEAGPGPHDAQYMFKDFADLMRKYRK